MDDDGQIAPDGDPDLLLKNMELLFPGSKVVVKIESDLTDGHDFGVTAEFLDLAQSAFRCMRSFMRMKSYAAVEMIVPLSKHNDLAAPLERRPRDHDGSHTS